MKTWEKTALPKREREAVEKAVSVRKSSSSI